MKQLACEMCGGTDLMKQDGAFVYQNCGMKYSVEEAKKMMIEGTVDVQGTVKVDNSAFVERYLQSSFSLLLQQNTSFHSFGKQKRHPVSLSLCLRTFHMLIVSF